MDVEVLTPEVQAELTTLPEGQLKSILFLEKHPDYPTHYLVESLDPSYIYNLRDVIGNYRSVFMFKIDQLRERAGSMGYERLIYLDDPTETLQRYEALNEPYPYSLKVDLKPFQVQGFNYCKDLKSDIINWSTGTGKSVYAVAKAKYLLASGEVEKVVVVSKGHNKINWQRQFKDIGDLEAVVADPPGNSASLRRERRAEMYVQNDIFIINYEKFRFRNPKAKTQARAGTGDGIELQKALKGKRVYFIWDEMPTKLKNQSTAAWKGANRIKKACKVAYQSMLSATPLENSPEDIYSCVKLLDPKIFGTLQAFRNQYAYSFNPFRKWQVDLWDTERLQEMGMRLAHITHQANKYRDPEIRAQFPQEHWEDVIVDMSPEDRVLYSAVEKQLAEEFKLNPQENILPKLLALQLICNNPAFLHLSDSDIARRIIEKRNVTDQYAAKIETLRELLDQIEGKVVLFSMYRDLGSVALSNYLTHWGHSHVLYDGSQAAQDAFTGNPDIKVFLSSDMGSDSINLEQATSVINFDLPWKYSTLLQRVNRINRITSEASHVWYYNLIVANTMEERKREVLERKRIMQEAVDNPTAEHIEAISTLSMNDLRYILLGNE